MTPNLLATSGWFSFVLCILYKLRKGFKRPMGSSLEKDSWDAEAPGICLSWISVQVEMCTKKKCLPWPHLGQRKREGLVGGSRCQPQRPPRGLLAPWLLSPQSFWARFMSLSSLCPNGTWGIYAHQFHFPSISFMSPGARASYPDSLRCFRCA